MMMNFARRMTTAALAASVGALAIVGAAYAGGYFPSSMDDRTVAVDDRNAIDVVATQYAMPNSQVNSETLARAATLRQIGEASENSSPIIFTNELGQAVKALSATELGAAQPSANVLSDDLAQGDALAWNWEYSGKPSEHANAWGQSYSMTPTYTFTATLADGTMAVFHDVNMNGVRTVTLRYSNEYDAYYVDRTTITNHTPDPTLYYEVNRVQSGVGEAYNEWINSSAYQGDDGAPSATSPQYTGASMPESFAARISLVGVPNDNDELYAKYRELSWNVEQLAWSSTHPNK